MMMKINFLKNIGNGKKERKNDMEPIISPWFFYWIGVVSSLMPFLVIGGIISFGALIFLFVTNSSIDEDFCDEDDRKYREWFKKTKLKVILPAFCAVCMISAVFIPSRKTLIQMKIAELGTKDNIENIINISERLKDTAREDIKEIIKEAKKHE